MQSPNESYSTILAKLEADQPELAAQARDLLTRDETFRSICQDFHEARSAAQQFASSEGVNGLRTETFRSVAEDLLTEAKAYLKRSREKGET